MHAITSSRSIYVDLDGTLLKTDMLWECVLAVGKQSPWALFLVPFWLARGRAVLKRALAERVCIPPHSLPFCSDILAQIAIAKSSGKMLILATATDRLIADSIAAHLGVFSLVIASDRDSNLKGKNKLAAIRNTLGADEFDYWGDSSSDLPIFAAATGGFLVRPNGRLRRRVEKLTKQIQVIPKKAEFARGLLQMLRLHQWAKNLLVFLPAATAHRLLDLASFKRGVVAFCAFSLVATANYILNDLLDLTSDREHPKKKYRPIAAGILSIPIAITLLFLLLGVAVTLATNLAELPFQRWLMLYFVLANLYTWKIKQCLILDLLCLSALYTIRIMAGGAVANIVVSEWLLAFSMFFFTSLAFAKRFTEIKETTQESGQQLKGRAYLSDDLEVVRTIGAVSGYLSIMVMSLYVNSLSSSVLYRQPRALWLICPLLAYWITRIWFLANRGALHHDPVMFAVTDYQSYIVAGCGALVAAASS